ncbi:ATP-binding cassette domain-containing protein [Neisseria weixii]|uniref:ATP-binding cassette domain-containing protein n=1 Tax=Neisseria weixii TaxID=1853276 RepID=UPI00359F9C6F
MTTTAVSLSAVSHHYGKVLALDNVSLEIGRGQTVGLIGPDGVGKSTLLSLIAGVRVIQEGSVSVLGGDMGNKEARRELSHRIAYMPQGLGQNLYRTLSVYENIDFHARLFGLKAQEREQRITRLVAATGLDPFVDRAAGKLSGGMKQKLSLCCALVHNPDLLILDEPTTGVDPLSRRQFWTLVNDLRQENQGMTVIVATAYVEEAQQFEQLLAMDDGKLLANQSTQSVLEEYGTEVLEEAYIKMLPKEKQTEGILNITPFAPDSDLPPAIEAHGLTKRFGNFTAVDRVSFTIPQGEIFGFLGSNGCGKSTTMKMLTGLLEATEGTAELLGKPIDAGGTDVKMRVGYMSQAFSLYEELSVRQNLDLHAKLYQLGDKGKAAVDGALQQFELAEVADTAPSSLPLGIRQRLQLAAACLHHPEVLILDEPTSGVDPAARDMFWRHLLKLSREDKITIFVSTHFMNEAERCDRISFMHKGRVLGVGTPEELTREQNAPDLEEAFVQYLIEAEGENESGEKVGGPIQSAPAASDGPTSTESQQPAFPNQTANGETAAQLAARVIQADRQQDRPSENKQAESDSYGLVTDSAQAVSFPTENDTQHVPGSKPPSVRQNNDFASTEYISMPSENQTAETRSFNQFSDGPYTRRPSEKANPKRDTESLKYWLATVFTFARRETKELIRDKIRLVFAVFGPVIMLAAMAWGVSFDVQNLKFAVYDRDQTSASRELVEYFSGSRYFIEQPPLQSEADIQTALESSQAVMVMDIPHGFGRDVARGLSPEVAFYIDGAMPFNAANIQGYVASLVGAYSRAKIEAQGLPVNLNPPAVVEPRMLYNQDFNSINAIAPGVVMLVLIMVPAMMAAVGVVREKEVGSIANFYASPASVSQYLIGKQLPYIGVGLINFAALAMMLVFWFGVPLKGSLLGVLIGTVLIVTASTAMGLVISSFVRSQLAAIFAAAIISIIPTINYSGFLYSLSAMSGASVMFGKIMPASWYRNITVGSFTKGLNTADYTTEYAAIAAFAAAMLVLACMLLKKQEK